jgi:hypothetical protein
MRNKTEHKSRISGGTISRREFVREAGACTLAGSSLILGVACFERRQQPPPRMETNIGDFMKVPRTPHSLPGPFPGRVVRVRDPRSLVEDRFDAAVISRMFEKGISGLTGRNPAESFNLFFDRNDVVGIKVNPTGAPLISTRLELVDAVAAWLVGNGIPKQNIVIWDRFDYELSDAGFTGARFPGMQIEGLQTMDQKGNRWRDANGVHLSAGNFDRNVFYRVRGLSGKHVREYADDDSYLNQNVFNDDCSYFGKLITRRLTKIVNLGTYKNTGSGVAMATKNVGYGSICNTARLHDPLFFTVCTEVLAAPVIRDKLVLNVTDGIRGQYDGGPYGNAEFLFANHSLYFATDPFALDMVCHREMVDKRKEVGRPMNEHPRYTDYLHYAETLGLGIANSNKIEIERIEA